MIGSNFISIHVKDLIFFTTIDVENLYGYLSFCYVFPFFYFFSKKFYGFSNLVCLIDKVALNDREFASSVQWIHRSKVIDR